MNAKFLYIAFIWLHLLSFKIKVLKEKEREWGGGGERKSITSLGVCFWNQAAGVNKIVLCVCEWIYYDNSILYYYLLFYIYF